MKSIIPIILLAVASACGLTTKLAARWKSPNADENIPGSILVTALTCNAVDRQTVETDLVKVLQENGLRALRSIDVLPAIIEVDSLPDEQRLVDKIKDSGVDAILTVALVDKEAETRYVPGRVQYSPTDRFAYYGMFLGYYYTRYIKLYDPGYYTGDKIYFMETNLYDADTHELIWSAQSKTYDPLTLSIFSKEFSKVVMTQLGDEGLINRERI